MEGKTVQDDNKNSVAQRTDAGIIIIGDEILKGHTKDTNASFLLSKLWTNGVYVEKVSFLPDNIDQIAKEVRKFSSRYSFVITAGGVGPTHDDVTYKGISKAFDEPLVVNKQIKNMLEIFSGTNELSQSFLKMATIPKTSKVIFGIDPLTNREVNFPLLCVRNVYIFPGVPEYLQKSFLANKHLFSGKSTFLLTKIYLSANEDIIASCIEKLSEKFTDVHVGSYPMLNDVYKVKVTLEAEVQEQLDLAYDALIKDLPSDIIVSIKKCLPNNRDAHHEMFNTSTVKIRRNMSSPQLSSLSLVDLDHYLDVNNNSKLSISIKCAWAVFVQTMQMYTLDEVCIGFNGGKDCTAILHLFVAFMKKMFPDNTKRLLGLYLKHSNPFEEAHIFIKDCEVNYNLEMIVIPGSIKDGLTKLKISHPQIKAVIMGTRRHDPYSSSLRAFTVTDEGWPSYMRVLPILDWSYCEVWELLRTFRLPYCNLYNDGYTSLGSTTNTTKNPALLLPDGRYSPAYALKNEFAERTGRDKKEGQSSDIKE